MILYIMARKTTSKACIPAAPMQMLVRFENERTVVVTLSSSLFHSAANSDSQWKQRSVVEAMIRQKMSDFLTGGNEQTRSLFRPDELVISHFSPPFCNCWLPKYRSLILGGKGGFGTLLKGQSRQASAQTTKDFGDCRDLQGRRLRHVNDMVQATLVKEWQEKIRAGTATRQDMLTALTSQTESGIAGWHLQVPAWSEVSYKKEQRHNKALLRRHERELEQKAARAHEQREREERQIAAYVNVVDAATASMESTVSAALQQGLQKKAALAAKAAHSFQQKSTDDDDNSVDDDTSNGNKRLKEEPEPPSGLLTLSGEASLALQCNRWRLQSQSNFCTFGVLLDQLQVAKQSALKLYYEVALISAVDVVQIGWAVSSTFQPNSDSGDGVGDCTSSWAFDVSRSILLYSGDGGSGGATEDKNGAKSTGLSYGKAPCRSGDVVGCLLDFDLHQISYTVNQVELGVAFTIDSTMKELIPAISCNPGVMVELRLLDDEVEFRPKKATTVGTLLRMDNKRKALMNVDDDHKIIETEETSKSMDTVDKNDGPGIASSEYDKKFAMPLPAKPLSLDEYDSILALESLGLDRLKSALMAVGLKCGGTLAERAARLLSIRGLHPDDYPTKLRVKQQP